MNDVARIERAYCTVTGKLMEKTTFTNGTVTVMEVPPPKMAPPLGAPLPMTEMPRYPFVTRNPGN